MASTEHIFPTEEELRREMVSVARKLHQYGWVANHDGNVSARLDGNFLCTPTAVSKADVGPESLIVVDAQKNILAGTRRAFSEFAIHIALYQARPDIGCVIHAHPPTTAGMAVANVPLGEPFMAEPVVSLGPTVPLVPFALTGSDELKASLQESIQHADVLMLANHGAVAVGGSFEQALLRMELVEHLCKIKLVAEQAGGVVPLSQQVVAQLAKKSRPPSMPDYRHHPATCDDAVQSAFSSPPTANISRRPALSSLIDQQLKRHK